MEVKKCTKCGEAKGLGEYSAQKTGRHGVRSDCKSCVREYKKLYMREYGKEYRKTEKCKQMKRLYWQTSEVSKNYQREYSRRPDRLERKKEYSKNYHKNNKRDVKLTDEQKAKEKERKKAYKKGDTYKAYMSQYNKDYKSKLPDSYIKGNLVASSIPITPETIELKRNIILIKRFKKQINEKSTRTSK